MSRAAKAFLGLIGVFVLVGLLAAVLLSRYGFSARNQPTMLETAVARTMRHLAVPGSDRSMKNPVPLSQEILTAGRAHFADHCATCHGNDGKGQTEIGQNLYPKAPDMTAAPTQSLSDGEIFSIIKNGVRLTGMPAWGEDTPEDDTMSWHIVHFIRHLPKITVDELEEMKSLNPRSPDELREEQEEGSFLEGKPATEAHKHHH